MLWHQSCAFVAVQLCNCADGLMAVRPSGTGWDLELFSDEGKTVRQKHVKAFVQVQDALQVEHPLSSVW
jgi:hypothetical protein